MATSEANPAIIKGDTKKKPGPNNHEEATRFVQEVDKAVHINMNHIPSKMHIQTSLRDTLT